MPPRLPGTRAPAMAVPEHQSTGHGRGLALAVALPAATPKLVQSRSRRCMRRSIQSSTTPGVAFSIPIRLTSATPSSHISGLTSSPYSSAGALARRLDLEDKDVHELATTLLQRMSVARVCLIQRVQVHLLQNYIGCTYYMGGVRWSASKGSFWTGLRRSYRRCILPQPTKNLNRGFFKN